MDALPPLAEQEIDRAVQKISDVFRKANIASILDGDSRTFGVPRCPQQETACEHRSRPDQRICLRWLTTSFAADAVPFLFWFPSGLAAGHLVSAASSRMSRKAFNRSPIGPALLTLVKNLADGQTIITGAGTTLDKPVRRACEWNEKPIVRVAALPKHLTTQWLAKTLRQPQTVRTQQIFFRILSPLAGPPHHQAMVDELLFEFADEIRVLHHRPHGNIDRLLNCALDRPRLPQKPQVYVLVPFPPKPTTHSLLNKGAIAWYVFRSDATSRLNPAKPQQALASTSMARKANELIIPSTADHLRQDLSAPIVSHPPIDPSRLLCHCTRAGERWPESNDLKQWDPFLLGTGACSSPLVSLCRILCQQKLLAGGRLIAENQRVVCLTEIPLSDLHLHRRFQSHLSRWDFEPFGIALDREHLQQVASARAVTYVHFSQYGKLTANERVFYQPIDENALPEATTWAEEREWRVVGDIDLRQFSVEQAVAFVPSLSDAQIVAPFSRWPIVVLENETPTTGNLSET